MRLVIAGGGTGGHLFPGIAIAEAFLERQEDNEVLFIGTERGIETKVLKERKFPLKTIRAMPLKGKSLYGKWKAFCSLPIALIEAYSILRTFQPRLVLGVGGYASGPTLLVAFLLGIKRAIHEQNVIPGMTNQILKWISDRIFVSFEETQKYFPKKKTIVTGNPIRREVFQTPTERDKIDKDRRFTLLIFGGSAGAHRINKAVVEALDEFKEIRSQLRFFHQTGKEDINWVSKAYEGKGFEATVKPFFEDMATCYRLSDLVICRSGASTVAELAVCGKAAILIPYPYAVHNHQWINAQKLVDLGAARMIRDEQLNGPSLAQEIRHLYEHPEERVWMEKQIVKVGKPKAAQEIVEHCYKLLGKME